MLRYSGSVFNELRGASRLHSRDGRLFCNESSFCQPIKQTLLLVEGVVFLRLAIKGVK